MGVAGSGEFRAATHGIWGVLICRDELVGVCGYAYDSDHQQKSGGRKETYRFLLSVLVHAQADEQGDGIYEYHYREIVCDLDMIGLYLHAEGKGEEHGSEHRLRQPLLPAMAFPAILVSVSLCPVTGKVSQG